MLSSKVCLVIPGTQGKCPLCCILKLVCLVIQSWSYSFKTFDKYMARYSPHRFTEIIHHPHQSLLQWKVPTQCHAKGLM
ncbi:hypothetical protein XENTR_v10003666 [Xenopus tropicalis]|nr:hypothetical protein XENTR_v10003666 [Xenopus tropicalis]